MPLEYIDIFHEMVQPSGDPTNEEVVELYQAMQARRNAAVPEQTEFANWCDIADNLYYPKSRTRGGASHWASHESANKPGRSHVSDNVYPIYVDIPAALQSVEPVENMVATDVTEEARAYAAMAERLYFAWKRQEQWELKAFKAATTKGLYGRSAAKVYFDDEKGYPAVEIVEQPRNLYFGWRDSNYGALEWSLYCYAITPGTALEDWGLLCEERTNDKEEPYAYVVGAYGGIEDVAWKARLVNDNLKVEVYDYWYRRPDPKAKRKFGKPVKFETWNAIFVGNVLVKNQVHKEYNGRMPYIPIFNTYIPGEPQGRPEFWDIEQFIREKDEKLSEGSQMISKAVNGQAWQLRGEQAPNRVPAGLQPIANKVIAPGAGNWIEAIQPWMPEFQLEAFIDRLDKETVDASGLNDLLRGQAPTEALSSSKAITALTANYEMRVRMKRDLFYVWRIDVWELTALVWRNKTPALDRILKGAAILELTPPSLMPRDDSETAAMARNLMEGRLWSQVRAMDHVGVDDPEVEQDMIRAERTDAALFPADVQIIATLTATLAQLAQQQQEIQAALQAQRQPQAGTGGGPLLAGANPEIGLNAARQQGTATGVPSLNAPAEQPMTRPEQMPANAPQGAGGRSFVQAQSMIQGGEVTPRIIQSRDIERTSPQGG